MEQVLGKCSDEGVLYMITALDAAYFDIQIKIERLNLPSVYKKCKALAPVSDILFFQSICAEQKLSFRRSSFKTVSN